MASHHQGNGEGRRSSTRAEVLRAMALAASSHDAPAGEDRGAAAGASSDRARANRTMSADINMSNRLNHLVRAEEAELQQLDINDPDSPRYAHDINTGGGIDNSGWYIRICHWLQGNFAPLNLSVASLRGRPRPPPGAKGLLHLFLNRAFNSYREQRGHAHTPLFISRGAPSHMCVTPAILWGRQCAV